MSDDGLFFLILGFWGVVAYAAYLRLFVIRRLNKKLDKFVDAALARPQAETADLARSRDGEVELRTMQQRLEVLERIAVEKEDSLSRQIEELHADRR